MQYTSEPSSSSFLRVSINAILLLLLSIAVGSQGEDIVEDQIIGEDICGCSPSRYEFTLDFSLFCPPPNVTIGAGIADASCLISPFGNPDTVDLVPVVITSIDFIELGQDISVIVRETLEGEFLEGDKVDYESITNTPEAITGTQDIPRGLQVNMIGNNANGEGLINVFILTYTNSCDHYPILNRFQSAGWAIFSELDSAEESVCPIAAESSAPVTPGTSSPVTPSPTLPPVAVVTPAPVSSTPAPVSPETPAPVSPETPSPVSTTPTAAPTRNVGTSAPTTSAGTVPPTDMSMSMDLRDLKELDEALDVEFGRD